MEQQFVDRIEEFRKRFETGDPAEAFVLGADIGKDIERTQILKVASEKQVKDLETQLEKATIELDLIKEYEKALDELVESRLKPEE